MEGGPRTIKKSENRLKQGWGRLVMSRSKKDKRLVKKEAWQALEGEWRTTQANKIWDLSDPSRKGGKLHKGKTKG